MQIIIVIMSVILSLVFCENTTAKDNVNKGSNSYSSDLNEIVTPVKHRFVRSIHSADRKMTTAHSPKGDIIVNLDPPDRDEIIIVSYENQDELNFFMTLPNNYGDLSYNVRFTPPEPNFVLIGMEIMIFDMFGEPGNPGIEVSVYTSEEGLPDEEIITFEVPNDDLVYYDGENPVFNEIYFADYDVDPVVFEGEDDFHIIVNVIINEDGDVLGVLMDEANQPTDRSGLWNGEAEEWYRLTDFVDFPGHNFAIHAVIDYPELGVVINELMSDNESIIQDPQDQFDPWIELFNLTDEEVSLDGVLLTNDLDEEDMWAFPEGSVIEAGGHLLIWADGDVDDDGLHTSFNLSPDGGVIGLFISEEDEFIQIDAIEYGEQRVDWSFGRIEDGENEWVEFVNPTPGESNEIPDSPIISIEPFRLDFDLIEGGEVGELEIIVTNNGEMILEIPTISVRGEYFSSPLEEVDEVFLVLPGDEGGLSVSVFFAPEDMGEFEGTLIILSNDPENPEVHIPLTGSRADHLIGVSEESIDFGDVETDEPVSLPLQIFNVGELDLIISNMNIDSEVFQISFNGEVVVKPSDTLEIMVVFSSLVDGQFATQMTIESNDPFDSEFIIEVAASRSGSFIRDDGQGAIPDKMTLSSVYPNPFNAKLQILFGLPQVAHISINIFDINGGITQTVLNERLLPGQYIQSWDAEFSPPGIYFVRMTTANFTAVRKVVLVK